MSSTRPPILLSSLALALLLALACLSACGSSKTSSSSSSAKSSQSPISHDNASTAAKGPTLTPISDLPGETALAHVGARPITVAAVEHTMTLKAAPNPVPDPPSYAGCIAHLKALAAAKEKSSEKTEAQLLEACKASYQELLQNSLSDVIHTQWLLGEAAERHLSVSAHEVLEEFKQSAKTFRTPAEFATYRKSTHQSVADMMGEIKLGKLTTLIFDQIKAQQRPASAAEVKAFYDAHLASLYTIPAGRRLRILRTTTAAAAQKAKQEIQAGKSFQSVVRELSATIAQPISSKNGEIEDLSPKLFAEKSLNDAIFSAKIGQLVGPITVTALHKTIAKESGSGSYVFEVIGTVPAKQTPLSAVKAQITSEMTKAKESQTLASGVSEIKSKWKARTSCLSAYLVKNCSQYSASGGKGGGEDPYTL